MKRVLVTAGPIPGRLDSVKYITNRFKGGLMKKVADYLHGRGYEVSILRWEYAEPPPALVATPYRDIRVKDVNDYYDTVLDFDADAYVLGAAVANLVPTVPWEGKFPSHEYQVGDTLGISFEITRRVIDAIKVKNPKACLIGYKLFDGSDEELINAARKTLVASKANAIFANSPALAKHMKYMVTQDFATIPMSFDEHLQTIGDLVGESFFRTEVSGGEKVIPAHVLDLLDHYPTTVVGDREFGTFATRFGKGFWTTSRGKASAEPVNVWEVDNKDMVVHASGKATMNAPLLANILQYAPNTNVVLHDHQFIEDARTFPYQFPGTLGEASIGLASARDQFFNIAHHGYIAKFLCVGDAIKWLNR